jgi:phosphoglycolate phosphatase
MYNYVLWDLDGTITKPEEGIFNSIEYAAFSFGLPEPNRADLYIFIGPPLQYSFEKFFNVNQEDGAKLVSLYREYYAGKGIYECEMYGGIASALKQLKEAGKTIALATSKPEKYARQLLNYFGIERYFDAIVGADMSPQSAEKSLIVARALKECGADKSQTIMVGDRQHDIIGAKRNDIDSVGVLYGYGSKEEFETFGATYIAQTPQDVVNVVLGKE